MPLSITMGSSSKEPSAPILIHFQFGECREGCCTIPPFDEAFLTNHFNSPPREGATAWLYKKLGEHIKWRLEYRQGQISEQCRTAFTEQTDYRWRFENIGYPVEISFVFNIAIIPISAGADIGLGVSVSHLHDHSVQLHVEQLLRMASNGRHDACIKIKFVHKTAHPAQRIQDSGLSTGSPSQSSGSSRHHAQSTSASPYPGRSTTVSPYPGQSTSSSLYPGQIAGVPSEQSHLPGLPQHPRQPTSEAQYQGQSAVIYPSELPYDKDVAARAFRSELSG